MAVEARLEELEKVFSDPEIDESLVASGLDEIIYHISGWSRHKKLRRLSTQAVFQAPANVVASKLLEFSKHTKHLQPADIGLALDWLHTTLSRVDTPPTDTVSTLLQTLGSLLCQLLIALLASNKGAKSSKRMSYIYIHHSIQALAQTAEHLREKYDLTALVERLTSEQSIEALVLAALLMAVRNSTPQPNFTTQLSVSASSDIMKLWSSVVLNAKPQYFNEFVAPILQSGVLDSFWDGDFVEQGVFDNEIVPQVHKALLRAPEAVVSHVIPSMLHNDTLVMDSMTKSSSLIANLSSSNKILRQNTAEALGSLLAHTKSPDIDGLLAQFKKVSNSDQRVLFAEVLKNVPASVDGEKVASVLSQQAQKESSELGIRFVADALVALLPQPAAVEAIKKGLTDNRGPLRREWVLALCAGITNSASESPHTLFASQLQATWDDITKNINAAASSKLASAGFGLVLLLHQSVEAIPAGLFASRVYEHLSSEREVEVLAAACEYVLVGEENKVGNYCLPAFAYACSQGSPTSRSKNLNLLHLVFSDSNPASSQLSAEFAKVLDDLRETNDKLDIAKIVSSIRTKQWMVDAFVLAHKERAKPARGWIQMCLAASHDPHIIVQENGENLFKRSIEDHNVEAVATLAFVDPDGVSPLVDKYLLANLTGEPMSDLDEAILKAPEGQLAVVTSITNSSRSKSSKKQSDEAWEEELRNEMAKKRGKLTPEEEEKLKLQTARRGELLALEKRVKFCCSILIKLAEDVAKGAENGLLNWFPDGINLCLDIINRRIPGRESAEECLASLSVCLSSRFKGPWKLATSKLLLQGKHLDLEGCLKMLYMLNPVSDRRLLDAPTMVYILPILRTVLAGYNGEVEDESADEAVLLVSSLLANQAEVLAVIPRGDLVYVLLELLGKFAADRSVIKDCLRRVAQRVSFSSDELGMLLDSSVAAPQDFVRGAALEIIDAEVDLEGHNFSPEIWISRFGLHAEVAHDIWTESRMSISDVSSLDSLIPYFSKKYAQVAEPLSKAYAAAALALKMVTEAYDKLQAYYIEKKQPPAPIYNEFGMEVKQKWTDPVQERMSVLMTMGVLVPHLAADDVIKCAKFIVDEGVVEKNGNLAGFALELGKNLITEHGKACVDGLLPIFEGRDIILFGFAAQYLPKSDSRLVSTVDKLLAALPSSTSQNRGAIIDSLGPLANRIDYQPMAERMLDQTFSAATSEERRGAAYGFAGLAKGVGLSVLGENSIVNVVASGVEDRKDAGRREGAQLLVIALSQVFGRSFEPYAIELMSQVLSGLGDMNSTVRDAANEAARTIMANTTSFGIKRQIPLALSQLDTTAWRGKKGAVELLGNMAYLSPQQLATSLATIVPEIVSLLNDTHKEVRASAKRSMKMFGDVIENPEVHKLVPTLLGAISDPTNKTDEALSDLLRTRFMHYIDSPSLALIIFVVQRGLRDRSANTKRKACQIVGNMSILTAERDLVPYLPTIMPDLQVAMTDPVPQTCVVACKALGVLVEKLGEDYFPNVIPEMMSTLEGDDPRTVGNKWGTAQGLAEVLHGLGTAKLEELLPSIVANCQSPLPHVRQGFVPLLLLLPGSFGASLTPYLSQLVPPLLRGLADQLDDVRENALKAGRRIVRGYATVAVDLLLPELENGLWSPSWRIRLASVELVGDLLMELLGKSKSNNVADRMKALAGGNITEDGDVEEDAAAAETASDAIESEKAAAAEDHDDNGHIEGNLKDLEILGVERRDRVLSAIFVCRADVVGAVRQAALDTWLSLIQNTPRTVKMILPTMVLMVVKHLGDEDDELQSNAARALAELVRRVSGALKHILPTLLQLLPDRDARQGICLGLVEVIPATPVQSLQEHERELMHIVRACLQDNSEVVREAATRALEELHGALGEVADGMLPDMVKQLISENDEGALAAIREMVAGTGASSVLAVAIPALLNAELDEFKATALAELCTTAPASEIHPYIQDVVNRLIRTPFCSSLDPILLRSCPESHLFSLVKNDEQLRAGVFERMSTYYSQSEKVDKAFTGDWVDIGFRSLEDGATAAAAESMLRAITSSTALAKSDLAKLSTAAYRVLRSLSSPIKAFASAPKGPAFVLPFFLNGLGLGSNVEKEESALAISEVVRRTDPVEMLKPVVTQITGPLIRIVGERTTPEVKAAVIYTLNMLLNTIPTFLKPFLPQLQRTFSRNLADPTSSIVRTRSAMALGSLIKLQTRIDPLTKEIVTGIRSAPDAGVRSAFLAALHEIVSHAGQHLGEAARQSIVEVIGEAETLLGSDDAAVDIKQLSLLAQIGAEMVAITGENENPKQLAENLVSRHLSIQSVINANALLVHAPKVVMSCIREIFNLLQGAAKSTNATISENGVAGLGKLLLVGNESGAEEKVKSIEEPLVRTLVDMVPPSDDRSAEARRLSIVIIRAFVEKHSDVTVIQPYLNDLVPSLFNAARDRNIPVKIAAEKTFLTVFDFVGRKDSVLFDQWFENVKESLDQRSARALPEYVRRVALRSVERDPSGFEEEGTDDLKEVWAIGLE